MVGAENPRGVVTYVPFVRESGNCSSGVVLPVSGNGGQLKTIVSEVLYNLVVVVDLYSRRVGCMSVVAAWFGWDNRIRRSVESTALAKHHGGCPSQPNCQPVRL